MDPSVHSSGKFTAPLIVL
nr:hypothetical protein [Peribacillus frigoritolerans]